MKQPRWSRLVIGDEMGPEDSTELQGPMDNDEAAGFGDSQIKPQPQKQEPDWNALAQQVSEHLGIPPFQFEVEKKADRYGKDRYEIQSPPMNEHAGIFQHGLEKIQIASFNSQWGKDKETQKEYYWLTLDLHYESWGGGSNGTDLATCWWIDGQWKVQWTRDRALEQRKRQVPDFEA